MYPLQETDCGKTPYFLSLRLLYQWKKSCNDHPYSQKHVMPCQHMNKEDIIDKASEKGTTPDFWLLYHILSSVPGPELHLTARHVDLLKQASSPEHDLVYLTKTLEQIYQESSEFTLS